MIPAGYERKKSDGCQREEKFLDSEDEDDEFEFDFCDSNAQLQFDTEANQNSATKQIPLDVNAEDITNNNDYYDDQTDKILDELKSSIIQRNIEAMKNLLQANQLDVNVCFKNDWIPLMYAASIGSWQLCEYLIQIGGDVFYSDDSFSVIHCVAGCWDLSASESDLAKIIELLVSKGVDVNSTDRYYQTPLIYAVKANNSNLIECLVNLNADINAQDDNEWTALSHACHKGYIKCVQKLLRFNADPNIYTADYFFPVDLADQAGNVNISSLIKRFIRVKKFENQDSTQLSSVFEEDEYKNNQDDEEKHLESFLNALNLSNLIKTFKDKQIRIKTLMTTTDEELKQNIGVEDQISRELILAEVKKFHLKNWKSSSLIPFREELLLDCNEVVAIISNLSRHSDYMSINVKYLINNLKESNEKKNNLFADKYLTSRLVIELKQALINSKQYFDRITEFDEIVSKNVNPNDLINAKPVDLIDSRKNNSNWPKICTSVGLLLIALSSLKIVKNLHN